MHKSIEEAANSFSQMVKSGQSDSAIFYPPNGGFTHQEIEALKKLQNDEELRSALRKLFASNSAQVLFELFNIIDGTGDPSPDLGKWSGVRITEVTEEDEEYYEFLHDQLFETYWDWRDIRNADWKLDQFDD